MIEFTNVTKYYPTLSGRKYVFRDLNFKFPENTNIGVLGLNGSGKTTLLRLIGGSEFANRGKIKVSGSISWPIGLAGGAQRSLTGRENALFVCKVYGSSDSEIKSKIEFIKEFSELGDYFEMPMKTFSSGMRSRLTFAISMAFEFDTYLIDEVTAVGDARFREKSRQALKDKKKASNYIMVSHNPNDLIQGCDAMILLDRGEVTLFEDIEAGIDDYRQKINVRTVQ